MGGHEATFSFFKKYTLSFSASTVFIITIGVQRHNVWGFFSLLFLVLFFLTSFKISCLCFLFFCSSPSIVLSENTHVIPIIYNETCMHQGEIRFHCKVYFLCGVVSTWSSSWQAPWMLFALREGHSHLQYRNCPRPPVLPHGKIIGLYFLM